ncbi:Beta-fructofuranosidase [Klebsormidium nitens]|uniref:beta-fructofuranosidase n=1 Tax=Klebsormidium nitens TaxID=105231 RepID=A0A1Y1I719_KLENI|nr:Beta-fructofuranosidase [Klebsormidium nitens]|eukprot:GAQ85722.1 Beta-fructofuranosidase [Klebsormidium nitens]
MLSAGVGTAWAAADLRTAALQGRTARPPEISHTDSRPFREPRVLPWAGRASLLSTPQYASRSLNCTNGSLGPVRCSGIWRVQNQPIYIATPSTPLINHRSFRGSFLEPNNGADEAPQRSKVVNRASHGESELSVADQPAILTPEPVLSEPEETPGEEPAGFEREEAEASVTIEGSLKEQILDLTFQSESESDSSESETEELPNLATRDLFGSAGGPDAPPADQPVLSATDPHRPSYHFQPESGFMNDPNGPVFIDNKYHIFYQFNPLRALWDWGVCWGHAVSTDLVHWEHRPVALTPTPNSYDQDGIFSGCCVNDQGVATILYTGVQIAGPESTVPVTSVSQLLGAAFSEVQCVATCKDDGTFIKHGPVISAPPAGLDLVGFRDPYVWREDDEWLMLLGSGIKEVGGTALLYRSPDLRQWDFVQPLIVGDHKESGTMWECPLLFKLGKWHVLCVSPDNPANPVLFWVGGFLNGHFIPVGPPKRLDLGNVVYAPNTCVDGKQRQLLWGWVQEVRDSEACVAAGYAGCLTLPRVVAISDDGELLQYPAEELSLLREAQLVRERRIPLGKYPRLYGVRTGCLEIQARFARGTADAVGIDIRELRTSMLPADEAPRVEDPVPLAATRAQRMLRTDPHEGVLVSYDFKRKWLEVAWWQPGPDQGPEARGELVSKGGALSLDEDEPLDLRVFLDRSVVEVFANNRACLTTRMYRAVIGVALIAKGGDAEVQSVDMWRMGSMRQEAEPELARAA